MNRAKPRKKSIFLKKYLSNESGMALAVGLMLLTMFLLLVAEGTQWAAQDIKRTDQYSDSRQAFYIAETGIQRVVNFMNYDANGSSPGAAFDGFNDELDGSNWPAEFANASFGGGTYTATIADNDDNDADLNADVDHTVKITSTGSKDGTSSSIEAVVLLPLFQPGYALITEGDLNANGAISVQGSGGSIHSNGDFTQSGGSATVTNGATASGTCTGSVCTASSLPKQRIPKVSVVDFKNYSNYILQNDGKLLDVSASKLYKYESGAWVPDVGPDDGSGSYFASVTQLPTGLWKVNGSSVPDGMYYVEGNVQVLNTPAAWQTSILSEGYIDFGANADVVNYTGSSSPDVDEMFLVAATDIKFSGTPSNQIQGLIYAGEQLEISGTVDLNGYAISADLADVENLVSPASTISGSMTLTYNKDRVAPFFDDKVQLLSWRQIN